MLLITVITYYLDAYVADDALAWISKFEKFVNLVYKVFVMFTNVVTFTQFLFNFSEKLELCLRDLAFDSTQNAFGDVDFVQESSL